MSLQYSWADYLRALNMNQAELARQAKVTPSTVSRWLSGTSRPAAEQVISIARATAHSPIGALVAAGYLDEDEVGNGVQIPSSLYLRLYSDRTLLREVLRRVEDGETHDDLTRPLDAELLREETDDVSGLSEDELRQQYDTAAGTQDQPNEDESTT